MFYYAAVMFKATNGKFSRTDSWITLTRREVVNLRVFPRGCLVQLTKEVEWIIYLIVRFLTNLTFFFKLITNLTSNPKDVFTSGGRTRSRDPGEVRY